MLAAWLTPGNLEAKREMWGERMAPTLRDGGKCMEERRTRQHLARSAPQRPPGHYLTTGGCPPPAPHCSQSASRPVSRWPAWPRRPSRRARKQTRPRPSSPRPAADPGTRGGRRGCSSRSTRAARRRRHTPRRRLSSKPCRRRPRVTAFASSQNSLLASRGCRVLPVHQVWPALALGGRAPPGWSGSA